MTFRPPSQSLTPLDYAFLALVAAAFLALCYFLFSFNLNLTGGGDFYMRWNASRAFILERVDPYGIEIPNRTRPLVYDRPLRAGDKPYILDTPFHLLLLDFPFALFPDPRFARAFYALLLELTLLPLAWLSLRLTEAEIPLWLAALFAALTAFNFYSAQAIQESSPALLLALLYAAILYSLRFNLQEAVGAFAAVSFYRWEISLPFLIFVALRARREKRAGVFYGFLMLTFVTMTVSLLLYANWLIPFLRAAVNNFRADFGFTLRGALLALFPAQGEFLAWAVAFLTGAALVYEGARWAEGAADRESEARRFYWLACLALASAPLLGFRFEMGSLAVLIIPLALVFSVAYDRWRGINRFLIPLLMLLVFLVPWSLALLPFAFARQAAFLFLPFFTFVGLYWIRWWALRPPRVWADLIPR